MLGLALGLLGGVAGAQGSNTSQTSSLNLAPASALENQASGTLSTNLSSLQDMINAGAGMGDVTSATQSSRDLAAMLQAYSQSGGIPSAADTSAANQYASTVYQPQQVALQQSQAEQATRAKQLASQLGRPVNDPIIQAKLAQEQMNQSAQLTAAQSSYGAQYAQGLSQQRLGYAAQLADVNNSLASQALSNRQALLSIGSSIQNSERNFRLNSADRTSTQTSGGGLQGAISGALAGFGAGTSLSGLFNSGGSSAASGGASGGATGGSYLGANTSFSMPSFSSMFTPAAAAPSASSSAAVPASNYTLPAFATNTQFSWGVPSIGMYAQ